MKIYNPGTLVVLKNFPDNVYKGIILKHNMDDDWWGGGYYEFVWTPEIYDPSGFHRLSFQQIVDWQYRKEVEVYPIETFLNEVRIGTFWLRHNERKLFAIPESIILPKNDIVMVIGIRDNVMNIKQVQYYSQKLSRQLECTMEEFYFNYRKL